MLSCGMYVYPLLLLVNLVDLSFASSTARNIFVFAYPLLGMLKSVDSSFALFCML